MDGADDLAFGALILLNMGGLDVIWHIASFRSGVNVVVQNLFHPVQGLDDLVVCLGFSLP